VRLSAIACRRWLSISLAALLLGACSLTVEPNLPLPPDQNAQPSYYQGTPYSLTTMLNAVLAKPHDDLLVFVAFSGGGKRSAAFAHGALWGLDHIPVDGSQRKLLDDVVYIGAVSGGSFAAAHYGLYGRERFKTFWKQFLAVDLDDYILGTYLLPWNWDWLVNPEVGTNDRMATIYGPMFGNQTFSAFKKYDPPFISIDATDIVNGTTFAFAQSNFDLLCSDLDTFPIARAVAASNGAPILLSPITLNRYPASCPPNLPRLAIRPNPGVAPPRLYSSANGLGTRAEALAEIQNRYHSAATSYVHLLDGGLADNLALRALLYSVTTLQNLDKQDKGQTASLLNLMARNVRRILVISVDGQSSTDPSISQEAHASLFNIFSASTSTPLDAYNFDTLQVTEHQVEEVAGLLRAACSAQRPDDPSCKSIDGQVVHISFAQIPDQKARSDLQSIPTALTLEPEKVADLEHWGCELIVGNPAIRQFVKPAGPPQSDACPNQKHPGPLEDGPTPSSNAPAIYRTARSAQ
jgi:NTE family protein